MTRKDFLQLSASAAVCAPLVALLEACATSVRVIYTRIQNERIALPLSRLGNLSGGERYAKVYVDGHANPILLFEQKGTISAVLSTCTHSGCEVKKLRTKFECPCHGSEYDLDGNVLRGPAPDPLQSFRVVRTGETIEIILRG